MDVNEIEPAVKKQNDEIQMANALRVLAMDAIELAQSGHPGMPMGMADVAAVLFNRFMKIDPNDPAWPDRDRFVLSAGHGSMLLYAIHHLLGYADMNVDQLRRFRQLGSRTAGHPEYGHARGVETTTGPLGQGLANAVGMALAERMMNARFGDGLVDHRTYVIAGDGCLMEGISQEAIDLAGHLQLGRLTVLWDDNRITIDGATSLSTSTDQLQRFGASGWQVKSINGHDHDQIADAINSALQDPRPTLISCRTVIGFGAPNKQGTAATHGAPLGGAEVKAARDNLNWAFAPFEIPESVALCWRRIAQRGQRAQSEWRSRLRDDSNKDAFMTALGAPDHDLIRNALIGLKRRISAERPKMATRQASEWALEALHPTVTNMIGGSADLTGSNNTRTSGMRAVARGSFGGDYLHYGIREHAMAAVMNGIALHGGLIPFGGTFLAFADYCRPAIRLSALMGLRVIYVMTHDSIGLGEDGPTHQPVEHLAALRAMPNILVFRPADAVETAEAWELALAEENRPSVLCLSRQALPTVRTVHMDDNRTAKGAYLLCDANGVRDVTLIASGSEVEIALAAADELATAGVKAAVVSAPCLELFAEQDESYRRFVLGDVPRVGVEAGVRAGLASWLDARDGFVGMTGFGASGPAADLYRHFAITPQVVCEVARSCIAAGASRHR